MNKKLLADIYGNFDIFHLMCLSAALMSTYNSAEFDNDAHKIISFIGSAFGLDGEKTKEFEDCILGDMMNIGLITDYQAIASVDLLSERDKENIELYEIKGRILEETAICEAQNFSLPDMRIANQIKANMKYEYFHHPYNAKLRFWQLNRLAKNGNIDITRQTAMLYALGIGCEKDFKKAEELFLKCLLWGDRLSSVLIDKLFEQMGKEDSWYRKIYSGEEINATPVKEHLQLMRLLGAYVISPQKQTVINTELANVLISDKISHKNKVDLILNWGEQSCRNLYSMTSSKENIIGFRVSKNE